MAVYNDSFMDNATNILDLYTGIGTAVGDQFLMGHLLLISFFMIFLVISLRNNFLETLIVDCFITSIIAILFFIAGMIPIATVLYPLVIMILGLVFLNMR